MNLWFFDHVGPGPRVHILVPATLAPIKYISCDQIMTWSICKLYTINRSYTSLLQIGDPANSRWVGLKKHTIFTEIRRFLIVTKQIVVESPIWTQQVQEQLVLHNLHIEHVTIQSEFIYLIASKGVRLKNWVFGGKTVPIATVWVFMW
jgi:hypothetical protein